MTPPSYSDRIDHAFAYLVKHYGAGSPRFASPAPHARAMNVAVTLARFGCDEETIVAGILRYVFEEAAPRVRPVLEVKVEQKFGSPPFLAARDATFPKYDATGRERSWMDYRHAYLDRLHGTAPRTLDLVAAHEIHWCGSALSTIERLGDEYLHGLTPATHAELLWWYRSLGEVLDERADWVHPSMLGELRRLSARLIRSSPNPR